MLQPVRIRYRHILVALLIVALAMALRMLLVYQRAASGDPQWLPLEGTDQEVYWRFITGYFGGSWPYRPYVNQPGITYFGIMLVSLFGPSIGLVRLAFAGFDAVACGLMIASGWLLTRRIWGGYLAGLLLATYPVAIFYSTTLLIAPLAMWLTSLLLFLVLWQRERPSWWKLCLLGATAGYLVATRINLVPVMGIWLVWWYFERWRWRRWLADSLIVLATMALVVAPFTLWNLHAGNGRFQLMTSTGIGELYTANNRNADGLGGTFNATETRDIPVAQAWLRDIRLDPVRYGGLLLRKAAIFWSSLEPANNISFDAMVTRIPWLGLNPIRFGLLAFVALLGIGLLAYDDRELALFFAAWLGWLMLSIVISFAISRLRYPTVVPLIALAALAVVRTSDWLRGRAWRRWLRCVTVPAVFGAALLVTLPLWALQPDPPLPPKPVASSLPDDAYALDVRFDDTLTMVGWRPVPYFPVGTQGWADLKDGYAVEIFWRLEAPTTYRYLYNVAFSIDGVQYAGWAYPIGETSYPPRPTAIWRVGDIHSEIVSIRFDDRSAPLQRTGDVRLSVFRRVDGLAGDEVIDATTAATDSDDVFLQHLALYNPSADASAQTDNASSGQAGPLLSFRGLPQPTIELLDARWSASASAGTVEPFTLSWRPTSNIDAPYSLFIHIVDDAGNTISRYDGPLLPQLTTENWKPDLHYTATLDVVVPDQPGDYEVYLGLYRPSNLERLLVDAPDNRPLVGQLTVVE